MPDKIHDETNVPIRWLMILAVGVCGIGVTFGGLIALANSNERRISKLEEALDVIPKIDRRLYRIEIERGIVTPKEDRLTMPVDKDEL